MPSRVLHPSSPVPYSVDSPSYDSTAYFTHTLQALYDYVLPTALLTPFSRPELLSACSIPVPASVMVATYAALRHVQCLNDKPLSGRGNNSPGTPYPETLTALNLTFSQRSASNMLPQLTPVRFDVVDLIQCIADTFAGIAARHMHHVVIGRSRRLPSRSAGTTGDHSWPQLEPLDTPHQDLVAWVRGPYDQWYHLLSLIHGTILSTIPRDALVEFDFYLCTYTGRDMSPEESTSRMTADPKCLATRELACVFRWTIRHQRLSRASAVTETTDVLQGKLESVNEILTQLGLPRTRSTWKSRSGFLTRKPSGRESPSTKASGDNRKGRTDSPSPRSSPSGSYAIGIDLFLPFQQANQEVLVDSEMMGSVDLHNRCSSGPLSTQSVASAQRLARAKSFSQSDTQRPIQPSVFPSHSKPEDYFAQSKSPMFSGTDPPPPASLEEASAAQVSEFMTLLKGLPIALYASMNSKFAHKLMEFFTHRAMADVATFQLVSKSVAGGGDKQPLTGSPPKAQRIPAGNSTEDIPWNLCTGSSHRRSRRPWAFVIVDDDLSTLCEQFQRLRNTLTVDYRTSLRRRATTLSPPTPYVPFTPSGETPMEGTLSPITHLPFRGRADPVSSQDTTSSFPESPSTSALRATTLVYFTSLPHYQQTKATLHELVNEQHTLPPPDVLVLLKPAGMKRLAAALYAAIYQPLLESSFLPLATIPLSHPGQSPLVTPADSTHRTPSYSSLLMDNLLFNPSLYNSSSAPALLGAHAVPHFIPDVLYRAIMAQYQQHLAMFASTRTPADLGSNLAVGLESPLSSRTGPLHSISMKSKVSPDVSGQAINPPQGDDVAITDRGPSSVNSSMVQRPSGTSQSPQSAFSFGDSKLSPSSLPTSTNSGPTKPTVPSSSLTKTSPSPLGGEASQSVAKPPSKGAAKMRSRLEQMRKNAARRKQAAAAQVTETSPNTDSTSAGGVNAETKPPDVSSGSQAVPTKNDTTFDDATYSTSGTSVANGGSDQIPALTDTGKPPILTTSNSSPLALFSTPYPVRSQYGGEAFIRGVTGMAIPPIKVLIVEDSLVDRRIIGRFMNNHSIKHDLASTGKEAIEKWNLDVFHLVFMDLQLPDMSGIEITREIRRLEALRNQEALHKQTLGIEGPAATPLVYSMPSQAIQPSVTPPTKGESSTSTVGTPTMLPTGPTNSPAIIVALTASNLESDRMEAYAAGCNDFLIKPIDTHWMRQKLLEWGAMHALIDFEGFKNWKVADAKRQEAKTTGSLFNTDCRVEFRHVRKDVIAVEPTPRGSHVGMGESLVFQRATGDISYKALPSATRTTEDVTYPAQGILGTIRFLAGYYLVLITGCDKVGTMDEQDIYRITDTKVVPFDLNMVQLDADQKADELIYLSMFKSALNSPFFYFSYTLDLTNTLQRQVTIERSLPLWKRVDTRFYWNAYLQSAMAQSATTEVAHRFMLPVIQGYVSVTPCRVKDHTFSYMLISRRSRFRVGTRYFSRGADEFGNVSNFVETEQVVTCASSAGSQNEASLWHFSHLQTRGSIPIFWAQIPNMKYVPDLKLPTNVDTLSAFKKHFDSQIAMYGDQVVVNLVNKKKYEEPMGLAYHRYTQLLDDPHVHYYHFDFHQECSKMRWYRISVLIDKIQPLLEAQSFYAAQLAQGKNTVTHQQTSVVRTNCMDCLDRTNVVQSVIARFFLTKVFRELQVLEPHENIDDFMALENTMRNVWANNADAVSRMYSGTGALKTDFTRTGQRTKLGMIQDGINSMVRYVKNNYLDGTRQDGLDLMLGNYIVQVGRTSPFSGRWTLEAKVIFACAVFAIIMLCIGVFVPRTDGLFSMAQIYYVITWLAVLAACALVGIRDHSYEFINWPKLVPYPYKPTKFRRRVYQKNKQGSDALKTKME
ncbi:Phosphoinositide phosphatase sac1 [Dispira simplex]|nr:Phosphoinositide phosphatase sac1 [Dispira simplex]